MKKYIAGIFGILFVMSASQIAEANHKHWNIGIHVGNAGDSSRPYAPSHQYPPQRPNIQRPPFPAPHRPSYSNGLNITYRAPSYTTYYQNTNMWVNGDPNVARIESRSYEVITYWQDLGLPAPPEGMYWIFENGRYMLVPIK